MVRISKHISYKQGTYSNTATRKGIDNRPNSHQLRNMILLAEKVFEPLMAYFGKPIRINSFFRSEELNIAVGGSKTSQHCKGEALDLDALKGVKNADLFHYIKDNLEFDQLIWEYGTDEEPDWVHVSYNSERNRGVILKAVKGKGYLRYG